MRLRNINLNRILQKKYSIVFFFFSSFRTTNDPNDSLIRSIPTIERSNNNARRKTFSSLCLLTSGDRSKTETIFTLSQRTH